MAEKKRMPSRILASLAFVALSGFAVSCGEEQPSGSGDEKPAQKAESAQKPPATPEAEKTEKAEKTEPAEKTEAEKTKPAEKTEAERPEVEKVEEPKAGQLPAGAGEVAEAAGDQYGVETARQYEESQYEETEVEESQYEESQDEEVAAAPSDTTMSLSVPALGISGTPVIDENSEDALTAGTMHLPGTGFPWQSGSNTYIAGHRIGYPGTPSDRIFYDLPSMSMGDEVTLTDANGETYNYAVNEIFAVTPFDTWVTGPTGDDTVTLQVCTETPDDWFTIGPRLMSSGPESGRLIVRAARV